MLKLTRLSPPAVVAREEGGLADGVVLSLLPAGRGGEREVKCVVIFFLCCGVWGLFLSLQCSLSCVSWRHGGGIDIWSGEFAAAGSCKRRVSPMAIYGMLRPHAGLYGCRAAAPSALALSVASHCVALQVVHPWRRCHRLSARPVADLEKVDQGLDLLFKGFSCRCAGLFCILFSCKDPAVILWRCLI
jgi:hypothetical protein